MPASSDLGLLCDAARAAGEIAMGFWKTGRAQAWEKPGDAGPLTEADLAVDRMLKSELISARPDYGWLSEESEDSAARLAHERVFIVDPIDGTRAFITGQEGFAHSLAVAEGGKITAAVVYLPARDQLYAAEPATPGATLNGAPIRPSSAGTEPGSRACRS